MKRSATVSLTVVAVVGLASCGRSHPDPCQAATFNEQACQQAVQSGGYYYGGSWYPMSYHYPYPYYYDSYRSYTSRGGVVSAAPAGAYTHSGATTASPGVERGGFGSIGAGHGAGE